MKFLDKKMMLFLLAMFLSYGNNALGYIFYITNLTGQDVKVRLHYAFGKLNKKDELVKLYDTSKFSWKFPNPKFGLCLTKIMVSTKKLGKWERQKAKIQFVSDERFKKIAKTGLVGDIFEAGFTLWQMTGCGNRDFVLVIDPKSKKIHALTTKL